MFFEKMMNAYWSKKAGNKKGFTLIEMMVVIAIIAALVGILVPTVTTARTKAAAATNAANLRAAKGEFTTMKLLNSDDYSAWTGGITAVVGVTAVNEQFVVSGDPNAGKAKAGTPLTVTAKNAVEMRDGDVYVAEGTAMNAQILEDAEGDDEVYVTYNDLPIAYFAAVAEFGTANPNDFMRGSNTAAAGEWVDRFMDWGKDIADGAGGKKVMGFDMYGSLITDMTNVMKDPAAQGDCLECAMNNIDVAGSGGLLGALVGNNLADKMGDMGYQYKGKDAENLYCAAYTKVTDKGGCSCNPNHGPESHVSTTSKIDIGAGLEACSGGGVHNLDTTHFCDKCKKYISVDASNKPIHVSDTSIPYMNVLLSGNCKYCNYCACCAGDGTTKTIKVIRENDADWAKIAGALIIGRTPSADTYSETKTFPNTYRLAYVTKKINLKDYVGFGGTFDVTGYADAGICMATDPVLGNMDGGAKDKGCGHSLAAHQH